MAEFSLWWIRPDLRLHDNSALFGALETSDRLLPLFLLDPTLLSSRYVEDKRLAFPYANLAASVVALREIGGRLHVRSGPQASAPTPRPISASFTRYRRATNMTRRAAASAAGFLRSSTSPRNS